MVDGLLPVGEFAFPQLVGSRSISLYDDDLDWIGGNGGGEGARRREDAYDGRLLSNPAKGHGERAALAVARLVGDAADCQTKKYGVVRRCEASGPGWVLKRVCRAARRHRQDRLT